MQRPIFQSSLLAARSSNQANMLESLFVCVSAGIRRPVQDFVHQITSDLAVHGHAVGELLVWLSAQVWMCRSLVFVLAFQDDLSISFHN